MNFGYLEGLFGHLSMLNYKCEIECLHILYNKNRIVETIVAKNG